MRTSDHLRPCPFCGGEARVFYSEEGGMWDVQCQGCGAMPYLLSPREARRAGLDPAEELARLWNRRKGPAGEEMVSDADNSR